MHLLLLTEPTFMGRTAGTWEALGTWATAVVALGAAYLALKQIRAAEEIRRKESWPYVAIYMETVESMPQLVELVIKNFGQTVATAIEIKPDRPLLQTSGPSGQGSREVEIPSSIPTLAPGQAWRTLWDFAPTRTNAALPTQYHFNISYQSPDGEKHSHTYELDWATHLGRRWVAVRTVHDAAKSLAKVEKTIAKWSESARGDISVYVRDGDKKDAERREAIEQQDDEFAAFRARNRDREAMSTEFDAEDDDSRPATDVNGID